MRRFRKIANTLRASPAMLLTYQAFLSPVMNPSHGQSERNEAGTIQLKTTKTLINANKRGDVDASRK